MQQENINLRKMILEVAILHVIKGKEKQFEEDFKLAGKYISSIKEYRSHSLRKCMKVENKRLWSQPLRFRFKAVIPSNNY